ncbi:hypothetical protein AVEN_131587-1 [Araneus ventricosus]|uniref:Uncharacterized protein n=1 Tax=Araneus ventricosus TaxID=182803 RepID=A0A4Y2H2R7_ARAVE|nr:hypothetical protein AVEN_131587-1 [Araneus ventricosus]
MDNFQRKTSGLLKNDEILSFLETCELTWLEKKLVLGLHPIVKEVTKNFWVKHCNTDTPPDEEVTANQLLSYAGKIDSIIEMLEPCEKFLKNYAPWAKQRKETIGALRNVEKPLKDLVMKCRPVLKPTGTKAPFTLSNFLSNLLKPSDIFTEAEKKALLDLKSEVEERRSRALEMCALDLNLLHELGACEFYAQMIDSINDLFGDDILHEILDDLLKLLKSLPEEIDNVENIYTQLRTCVKSILPKTRNLLSNGFSISCIILSIFLVVFVSRRQSCAILIHGQDLGILNSAETEVAKLIAAARVKDSKLEKMISSEMKKKIAFDAVDNVAIILEMATIFLNSIDMNDGFFTPEARLVVEITNKLEKDLGSLQKSYQMFEKSSKERLKIQDITNWTTIIIYHIPEGTDKTAIKNAVKHLLRVKAQDCINLKRLPTNGNNWLVKVPTCYSRTLLKEKFINIAKENCLIMS